ncbi:MAG: hypothetical protein MUF43_02030 [Flavobacterium sp.]|jgi:hypothetical protein|nr:hypothetical protein [Flavobacterium sp.]
MKFVINLMLLLFISFLAAPTVVGLVNKEVDVSCYFNVSEEEEASTSSTPEIKMLPNEFTLLISNIPFLSNSSSFFFHELMRFNNLSHKIFSPPPNFL